MANSRNPEFEFLNSLIGSLLNLIPSSILIDISAPKENDSISVLTIPSATIQSDSFIFSITEISENNSETQPRQFGSNSDIVDLPRSVVKIGIFNFLENSRILSSNVFLNTS